MATIQEFIALLKDVKQSGNGFMAKCPSHDDQEGSLAISEGDDGRILLNCFAGCETKNVVAAMGLGMKDLFPNNKPFQNNGHSAHRQDKPFTVEDLAKDKGLPASFLESLGVQNIGNGVKITYYTARGKLNSKQRFRWSLAEKPVWSKKGKTMICYGGWRIKEMAEKHDYMVLVEGESDSWTLWHHDLPAIGVPGADMGKLVAVGHVKPFDSVYIWKEHGRSGETFLKSVPRRLAKLEYQGKVFMIRSPEYDDPNDLHKATMDKPGGFLKKWQEILRTAEPVDLQELPESSATTSTEKDNFKEKVKNTGFFSGDVKNARRLIKNFDRNMRYSPERKKWLHWNGKVWEVDFGEAALYSYVKATINDIAIQAVNATDPGKQEQLLKEAYSLSNLSKQKNMIEQASKEKAVQIFVENMDADPWLFCCESGTIDLRTGRLREHRRKDFITKIAPVGYDPDAKSELFDEFLKHVLPDKDVRCYVQKAAGYSLTGSTAEEKLFFAFGPPASGKSTFIETVRGIMGPHAVVLGFDTLLKQKYARSGAARPDLAKLMGVRFASAVEAGGDQEFDEELINRLTGGDTITARHLYGEEFDFKPIVKLWLAANNIPQVSGPAGAIWRRLRLIPFNVSIPPKERDKTLKIKLQTTEAPAVLAWMVEGCLLWQKEGLEEPEAIRKLTEKEQGDSDPLKFFIEDCCLLDPQATVRNPALWKAYSSWARETRAIKMSQNRLTRTLGARPGIDSYRNNGRVWVGIGLISEQYQEEPF